MRNRLLSQGILLALVIALAGVSISVFYLSQGDPFGDNDAEEVDEGYRQIPGTQGEPAGNEEEERTPAWMFSVIGATLIGAMVFVALSGSLYMRSKRGENLVRNDLLDLITVNPGINLASIRKELQLSQGAVSYHIMKLEKMGKIFSEKGSKERRYYPSSMGYRAAMELAQLDEIRSILENDTSQMIVEMLKGSPRTQNEIVKELHISPSTVHWHMERMKRVGMVTKENHGRSVLYELDSLPDLNT